jgi:hypothetical protein
LLRVFDAVVCTWTILVQWVGRDVMMSPFCKELMGEMGLESWVSVREN